MGLYSMKTILDIAKAEKYTVAAFNFFNFSMLDTILEAAEVEKSPVIVQISNVAHGYLRDMEKFVRYSKEICESSTIPVALNHDHCSTVERAIAMIDCGFESVMYDGSHLAFEDNILNTRKVVDYAHERGVVVEAELGEIPGFEDDIFADKAVLTNSIMAKEFVEKTKCDFLVVSVGTAHGGVLSNRHLPLHFDRLIEIHETIPDIPLVLHGAASLPQTLIDGINAWGAKVPQMRICSEADISKCGKLGVCKANMDVDNFLMYTTEIRKQLISNPEVYHPIHFMKPAYNSMKDELRHKFSNVVLSSGKA